MESAPPAAQPQSSLMPLLAVSHKYFGKMLAGHCDSSSRCPPAPSASSAKSASASSGEVGGARAGREAKGEHDSYYPQSWLIAYFALNGMRCTASGGTGATAAPPSVGGRVGSGAPSTLALDDGRADALVEAVVACCRPSSPSSPSSPPLPLLGAGESGFARPPLRPPQWLVTGCGVAVGGGGAPRPDVAAAAAEPSPCCCPSSIGVCPDATGRSCCGSPSSSLGPTITLTFCCLQTMLFTGRCDGAMGMRRTKKEEEAPQMEGGGTDGATPTAASLRRPYCLLEEASERLHSGGLVGVGGSGSGSSSSSCASLLAHRMALFAWEHLAAFGRAVAACGGDRGDLSCPSPPPPLLITDPRDLYSALMILWLVYGRYHHHHNMYGDGDDDRALLAAFLEATWGGDDDTDGHDGEKAFGGERPSSSFASVSNTNNMLASSIAARYIIGQCYVSHEGAFGAPPAPPPPSADSSSPCTPRPPRAVEAHTGMTYCCTVSLALLGHFTTTGSGKEGASHRATSGSDDHGRRGTLHDGDDGLPTGALLRAVRRYLYARQAHYGLAVSEYDDYSDTTDGGSEAEDHDEEEEAGDDHGSDSLPPSQKEAEGLHGDDDDDDDPLAPYRYLRRQHRYLAATPHQCPQEQSFRRCGFQGRPNKDSDTCYSFWAIGALRALGAVDEGAAMMGSNDNGGDAGGGGDEDDCDSVSVVAKRKWVAVDAFLEMEEEEKRDEAKGQPPLDGVGQQQQQPPPSSSSPLLLYDASALRDFTLLTARQQRKKGGGAGCFSCAGGGGAPSAVVVNRSILLPIAKDADEDTTPDPVHAFLGMAGLTADGGAVPARLLFPFA